jgi:hypothetical protein
MRHILEAHDAIAAVAGHDLPSPVKEQLDAASLAVGEPNFNAALAHLAVREGKPDWRGRLGRHMGHALEGLAVAHYHYMRTLEIERDIATMLRSLETPLPSSTTGFPSRKLNAEYQAFVFALRRSMEYFAAAVGAFFKTDCRRIRTLEESIVGREPLERSEKTIEVVRATLAELPYLLTARDKQKKSVRDRLAHEEYVWAGTFNAAWDADGELTIVAIIGGGEELPGFSDPARTLSAALFEQFCGVAEMMVATYRELGLIS